MNLLRILFFITYYSYIPRTPNRYCNYLMNLLATATTFFIIRPSIHNYYFRRKNIILCILLINDHLKRILNNYNYGRIYRNSLKVACRLTWISINIWSFGICVLGTWMYLNLFVSILKHKDILKCFP